MSLFRWRNEAIGIVKVNLFVFCIKNIDKSCWHTVWKYKWSSRNVKVFGSVCECGRQGAAFTSTVKSHSFTTNIHNTQLLLSKLSKLIGFVWFYLFWFTSINKLSLNCVSECKSKWITVMSLMWESRLSDSWQTETDPEETDCRLEWVYDTFCYFLEILHM